MLFVWKELLSAEKGRRALTGSQNGDIADINDKRLKIIKNGSIPKNSIIFVTFKDKMINSSYFTKEINTNVTSIPIDISLINNENRLFVCGFYAKLENGTLSVSPGKYLNALSSEVKDYTAPDISEIALIKRF